MPILPGRLQLGFIHRILQLSSAQEEEVPHLAKIGPCRGIAIDVGANYGLYSLPLSKLYSKVIAFEPNPQVSAPLVNARLSNVTVIHEGLSSAPGAATLYVPVSQGVVLHGWASLNDRNCPEATTHERISIVLKTLDSMELKDVGFVKIDVEGHELEVLHGGAVTIQRDHPHLLIEVKDEHRSQVRALLSEWGYLETTLQEVAGRPGSPDNLIFIPSLRGQP